MSATDPPQPASPAGEQRTLFAAAAVPGDEALATLDGELDRITFRNSENGFTVARLGGGEATIVGELGGLPEGTPLRVRGTWVDDRKFGRQLKLAGYQLRSP